MNTTRSQTANNEVFSTSQILNAAELNELRRVQLRVQKPQKKKKKMNSFSEDDDNLDLSSFASKKAASAGYEM